jgi:hypothetical protein
MPGIIPALFWEETIRGEDAALLYHQSPVSSHTWMYGSPLVHVQMTGVVSVTEL